MICAVTCFYNPCGYRNLLRNYELFRARLGDVELFTIELTFSQRHIPDATITLQGTEKNVLWQKERLLNVIVASLPAMYDKVAWLDADVTFSNGNWAVEAESRLDNVPVVQLFERVRHTDDRLHVRSTRPGIVASVQQGRPVETLGGAPGYAWAARRDVFPLYDGHVMGGGDLLMTFAWYGQWQGLLHECYGHGWQEHFHHWARSAHRKVHGELDCIRGTITHLYHGSQRNRNYAGRLRYLTDHGFDPTTDLARDDNGLWKWATNKPEMHRLVAHYFTQRREDDCRHGMAIVAQ